LEFVTKVASIIYTNNERPFVVKIRGWLKNDFEKAKEDNKFIDSKNKEIENVVFRHYVTKVVYPRDKVIIVSSVVPCGEVSNMIKDVVKKCPTGTCDFYDPS